MSPVHAGVATTDESALSATDYTALTASTNTATFTSGQTETTFDVTIKPDDNVEGNEQFLVTMDVTEPGHVEDELYQTTVVIADDDTPGKLRKLGCSN